MADNHPDDRDAGPSVRLGTDLITFFDLAYWGIAPETSYEEWIGIVEADPRRYFDGMLDGCVEAGVEGIELAPHPGGWRTALSAYGGAQGLSAALAGRGLSLSSSFDFGAPLVLPVLEDSSRREWADAQLREHAEVVRALGGNLIVLGSIPRAHFTDGDPHGEVSSSDVDRVAEQFDALGAATAALGVRIALHTDAYSVCGRAEYLDRILSNTAPEHVSLCIDAGHLTLDGSDAVGILRDQVDRVPIMHWKDCIGALDGSMLTGPVMERHATMLTYFRVLGNGIVDWQEWQRILRDARWKGWAIAEIDMSPDPIGEVRAGIDYFERTLAPIHR